jgi:hypothetical protein
MIFLDLGHISIGVLVCVIHWHLKGTKIRVILLVILLCLHSKLCFQLIIEKCNGKCVHPLDHRNSVCYKPSSYYLRFESISNCYCAIHAKLVWESF